MPAKSARPESIADLREIRPLAPDLQRLGLGLSSIGGLAALVALSRPGGILDVLVGGGVSSVMVGLANLTLGVGRLLPSGDVPEAPQAARAAELSGPARAALLVTALVFGAVFLLYAAASDDPAAFGGMLGLPIGGGLTTLWCAARARRWERAHDRRLFSATVGRRNQVVSGAPAPSTSGLPVDG